MVRRTGDKTPAPPGGAAAERLRMFEQARRPVPPAPDQAAPNDVGKTKQPKHKGRKRNEEQRRRGD